MARCEAAGLLLCCRRKAGWLSTGTCACGHVTELPKCDRHAVSIASAAALRRVICTDCLDVTDRHDCQVTVAISPLDVSAGQALIQPEAETRD